MKTRWRKVAPQIAVAMTTILTADGDPDIRLTELARRDLRAGRLVLIEAERHGRVHMFIGTAAEVRQKIARGVVVVAALLLSLGLTACAKAATMTSLNPEAQHLGLPTMNYTVTRLGEAQLPSRCPTARC
jgi:hypothetical protein